MMELEEYIEYCHQNHLPVILPEGTVEGIDSDSIRINGKPISEFEGIEVN